MSSEAAAGLVAELSSSFAECEVFTKSGRSRSAVLEGDRLSFSIAEEVGWAVRAGHKKGSFFVAGTGSTPGSFDWPKPVGPPLRLPSPRETRASAQGQLVASPMFGERESAGLLTELRRALAVELPEARLVSAVLDEGQSTSSLASSRGALATFSNRGAALRVRAVAGGAQAELDVAAGTAGAIDAAGAARRLADRLHLQIRGGTADSDRADVLLAPTVAIAILRGLVPLLVGEEARARARALRHDEAHWASSQVTIVDDGEDPRGPLAAPVDGEGVATGRVLLVDEGVYRQPLLAWWQDGEGKRSGCALRPSWRDLPQPGPTQLFIEPRGPSSVLEMLRALGRGYYWIAPRGALRLAWELDRFTLPVCGFAVRDGEATQPISSAVVGGSIRRMLGGVQAVGRDLMFEVHDRAFGSPSLLVSGLEIR